MQITCWQQVYLGLDFWLYQFLVQILIILIIYNVYLSIIWVCQITHLYFNILPRGYDWMDWTIQAQTETDESRTGETSQGRHWEFLTNLRSTYWEDYGCAAKVRSVIAGTSCVDLFIKSWIKSIHLYTPRCSLRGDSGSCFRNSPFPSVGWILFSMMSNIL